MHAIFGVSHPPRCDSFGNNGYSLTFLCMSLIRSGKMIKTIFKGDEEILEATLSLKSSIDSYNNALGNVNLRIVIKVYELLKGIYCTDCD